MSGHTPGPWSIEPAWSERCGGDVAIVNRGVSGDDWDICTVHSTEANARLIAAAPELLAVAMKCADEFDGDYGSNVPLYYVSLLDELKAAIAKATGAQP